MPPMHLLGGEESVRKKKGTYLPRAALFLGVVVVVTLGQIDPKRKIASKSEILGVRTRKMGIFKKIWKFPKFEHSAALEKIRNLPKNASI